MTLLHKNSHRILAVLAASLFATGAALAEKGEGHGNKHAAKAEKHAQKQAEKADKHAGKRAEKAARQERKQRDDVRVGAYFNDRHREAARAYYHQHYSDAGRCPPGLAKKNNGCLPPGQAKKWAVGQPLPRGVAVYPVPQPVLVQLPPPPYGYRYVRVGGDIVLVQARGNLVVDIIVNLF